MIFKSACDVKKTNKVHLKTSIISPGRKTQSILQMDSFRRLWLWNTHASSIYSSAGRCTQSRKLILQRRTWIYDAEASATEQGLFPSGLGAAAAVRFTTRMTQLITLGYWRELDMDQFQGWLVCLCLWKGKGNHRKPPICLRSLSDLIFTKSPWLSTVPRDEDQETQLVVVNKWKELGGRKREMKE